MVCGIIAVTLVFLDLLIIPGVIHWILPTFLAIIAIFLGDSAAEKGDKLGSYAMIIGGIYFLIIIVSLLVIYIYLNLLF